MHVRLVIALILLLLAASGCVTMEPTPRPTRAPPEEYITAKEAYARILPAAREWDAEFVVTYLWISWHPVPEYRAQPDGTAPSWGFELHSPTKWTLFRYLSNGSIRNASCWDGAPAHMCERAEPVSIEGLRQSAIPMDEIIDSDEAAVIVQGLDVPDTAQLRSIAGGKITSAPHLQRFAWGFAFKMPDGANKSIFVDMLTGEVVHSDFAQATPAPTTGAGP